MLNDLFCNFKLFFFLILFSFKYISCQSTEGNEGNLFSICKEKDNSISDKACFNKILKFENYKLNNFAKFNDENIFVEFTGNDEKSKKFFELTNGQSFNLDESYNSKGFQINIDETIDNKNLDFKFVGSKNLIVHINNNQYLLCINEYNFLVELYDDNSQYIWDFKTFFNLNEGQYPSYFSFEIFELKDSTYIIVFIPMDAIDNKMSSAIFIKRFKFQSLEDKPIEDIKSVDFQEYENQKILNVFFRDDQDNNLVVLSCKANNRRRISKIIPKGDMISLRKASSFVFNLQIYNNEIEKSKENEIYFSKLSNWSDEKRLFIKSLYLYNNGQVFFIYYIENNENIYFESFNLNDESTSSINPSMNIEIQINNKYK